MTDSNHVPAIKRAAIINLLAGIWLFISPWVYLAYHNRNSWNEWIVGALIVILAATRLGNPLGARGVSVVNMLLGIWTFASPWIYGYTDYRGRFINSLCVGVIVFVFGLVNSSMRRTVTPDEPHPVHP
jgi:SPW repeat